jgi:hypothetical protein
VRRGESHFWATHGGAELDLLVVRGRRRLGFEFKRATAPTVTASMRTAMQDLSLERLDVRLRFGHEPVCRVVLRSTEAPPAGRA